MHTCELCLVARILRKKKLLLLSVLLLLGMDAICRVERKSGKQGTHIVVILDAVSCGHDMLKTYNDMQRSPQPSFKIPKADRCPVANATPSLVVVCSVFQELLQFARAAAADHSAALLPIVLTVQY